ncbi:MAG: Jag family protein [Limisphaerales bacterium]
MPANAKAIAGEFFRLLGFTATIVERPYDDGLLLEIECDEASRLIGRQGQTLSDLQYVLNRIIFQQDREHPRVTVDVANYRAQAREVLVRTAHEAAEKVRKWGDVVELEPLNAFDRRIIHHALRDDPTVETLSVEVEGTAKKAILLRPKRASN